MREKKPDKPRAMSLLKASRNDIKFTLSIEITKESSPTIVRNIYESFRRLGEAILIARGFESSVHAEALNELFTLKANTKRPVRIIENLKGIRDNINYRGYEASINDAKEAAEIAKDLFKDISKAAEDRIEELSKNKQSSSSKKQR